MDRSMDASFFLASLCEGGGPAGPEGEKFTAVRNISGYRKVLSPTACGRSPSDPGPSVASRHLPTPWGVTLAEGAKGRMPPSGWM